MFSMMRIISYSIVMTRKMLKDYYNKASVSDGLWYKSIYIKVYFLYDIVSKNNFLFQLKA